jgi:hypothetical protein
VEYVHGKLNDESADQVWKHGVGCTTCAQEIVLLRGTPPRSADKLATEESTGDACQSDECDDSVLTEYIHLMLDRESNRDVQDHLQKCEECCGALVVIKRNGCFPDEKLLEYAGRNIGISHDISDEAYHRMGRHLLHCADCRKDVLMYQRDVEISCPGDENLRTYTQACLERDYHTQLASGVGLHIGNCDACRKRMAELAHEAQDQLNSVSN